MEGQKPGKLRCLASNIYNMIFSFSHLSSKKKLQIQLNDPGGTWLSMRGGGDFREHSRTGSVKIFLLDAALERLTKKIAVVPRRPKKALERHEAQRLESR